MPQLDILSSKVRDIIAGKKASDLTQTDLDTLSELHDEIFDLPTGGLYNPSVDSEDENEIIFNCHYNNYENDGWQWSLNKNTFQFDNL